MKTITASTMAEALAEVRRRIGSGAVILHTRQYKRGGILGLGARQVVEVIAADGQAVGRHSRGPRQAGDRRPSERATPGSGLHRPHAQQGGARQGASTSPAPPAEQESAGDLIRRTYAAARAELAQRDAASDRVETSSPAAAAHAAQPLDAVGASTTFGQSVPTPPPQSAASHEQLAEEMEAVKRMVGQVMRQQTQNGSGLTYQPGSGSLEQQYLALIQQEVAQELAQEIVDEVHRRLNDETRDDEAACREAMRHALAEWLPTESASDGPAPTEDGRPRTIALVGPTGVGKTTTIAKLAATFKIKQNRSVGLVTLDTYRIAAVDQLRTYARIIGLDLHVASTAEELQQALDKLSDCETVLIDTAGRSQRNEQRLDELAEALNAVNPHEVHLVLSSTCSERVLEQTVARFSAVRTDRIIFTKLDEAVTFGVMLNVARKVNKQLSFITTGQDVPHQIEPGHSQRLAALVLGHEEVGA